MGKSSHGARKRGPGHRESRTARRMRAEQARRQSGEDKRLRDLLLTDEYAGGARQVRDEGSPERCE